MTWVWAGMPRWVQIVAVLLYGALGAFIVSACRTDDPLGTALGVSFTLVALVVLIGTGLLANVFGRPWWLQALASATLGGGLAGLVVLLTMVLLAGLVVIVVVGLLMLVLSVLGDL